MTRTVQPFDRPSIDLPGYTYVEPIYQGSRTLVYRAVQIETQRSVVVKMLRQEYPGSGEVVQLRNQYAIAKDLPISGIIHPLSLEPCGNGYALIMEDWGGISLERHSQPPFAIAEVLAIALQLADILHDLHQHRIIHKDIKPGNILIHPDSQQVKLIDFSIASLLPKETQDIQSPNTLEGTLAYLAPEQTGRMNRGIDYRADYYALGVTLYQLFTGRLPFAADDPLELVHCHLAKAATPVHQVNTAVPESLGAIVAKLMAKNAEDRYQSALGLKHDLEECLSQWERAGTITGIELGQRDVSDRFIIPETLYGRQAEVHTLLDAFDRVAEGASELILVAGFSGIGKTAVIKEVHKPITRQQGYFIQGKFDQFNRNVPFSAFVQAFRSLLRQLLGESDAALAIWRAKILAAVGTRGQVIIEVIPELERIIGAQPAVAQLSGSAAQNRFNLLFSKFVGVFATQEHPLVIFLDDLQWVDSASLNLLRLLTSESGLGYFLMVGAYRDNEISPAHPLMLMLDEVATSGSRSSTITLKPLTTDTITQLVADTLLCTPDLARPLAQLIDDKTQGNPFFTVQFLQGLYEEGCIHFDHASGGWQYDLSQARQLVLTDDVVAFMVKRLQKLPKASQDILKLAACIGNRFELQTLATICASSQREIANRLWQGLQEGFIIPVTETYKLFIGQQSPQAASDDTSVAYRFIHDRIQQAAYKAISSEQRASLHYKIGQRLLAEMSVETQESQIFELVGQLNYGITLPLNAHNRQQLIDLNLLACRKARATTAYQAGLMYARIGLQLLGESAWQAHYQKTLEFHNLATALASLCGDLEAMDRLVQVISTEAHSILDCVESCRVQLLTYAAHNRITEAVQTGRSLLKHLSIDFSDDNVLDQLREIVADIEKRLADREIEALADAEIMTDAQQIARVQLLNALIPAAKLSGSPTFLILSALSTKLCIQSGAIADAAMSYSCYAYVIGNILNDIDTGVRFGDVAVQVMERFDAESLRPEVTYVKEFYLSHRKHHIRQTLSPLKAGYASGLEVGRLDFASYIAGGFCFYSFWAGRPLSDLEQETRAYYALLKQLNQNTGGNWCAISLQMILNLLGKSEDCLTLSGEAMDEATLLPKLFEAPDWTGIYYITIYKLYLAYLFNDLESFDRYQTDIMTLLKSVQGNFSIASFYFYSSLAAIAKLKATPERLDAVLLQVKEYQAMLARDWVAHSPENHQHKWDLVEAEIHRICQERSEAIEQYDRAIAGAKQNGFMHEEALANELAAKFYLDWGKEKVAVAYLQEAYACYTRWGANAKLADLDTRYPNLLAPMMQPQPALSKPEAVLATPTLTIAQTSTTHASSSSNTSISAHLDLATILKASQTLSSAIELDKLLATLLYTVLENAGADRGALLMCHDDQWWIEAVATVEQPAHVQSIPLSEYVDIPEALIHTVRRSLEPMVIVDATAHPLVATDVYVTQKQPKSLLCTPIRQQGKLLALLYLENQLTAGAFTRDRVELLNFLCAQAAISLENARLYQQAQTYAQKLEQSQLQVVQSEKMATLGNLMAGVAHEINNPLGFLNGSVKNGKDYTQALLSHLTLYQQHYPTPVDAIHNHAEDIDLAFLTGDLPKLLDSMKGATDRLKEISTSLRTFSRADTDRKVRANLHDGLDSTLLILKYRLKANDHRPAIEVIKDYGDLPEIECFPGQLNQVFMNILANAIDALDEASLTSGSAEIPAPPNRITIRTTVDPQQVTIAIADNGPGMPDAIKTQIFDHLFTTKPIGKGTGLGLAIARQIIVETHDGSLEVQSTVGQGSAFLIQLPI